MATQTPNILEKKKFQVNVKDSTGHVKLVKLVAPSAESLSLSLEKRGFVLLDEPVEVSTKGLNAELSFGRKKRVKPRDVARFARKFSSMQDAGVPVKRILQTLGNSEGQNPTLRETIKEVEADLITGISLATAMGKHPLIFPDLMTAMTNAGEKNGFLTKSMRQVAENLEAEVRLKSKIKSAMTYPVVVLVMAGIMCAGMLLFIVPIFDEMFSSLGSELPLPTQILVSLSEFLKIGIIPIAIMIAVFLGWWRKNKHKYFVRKFKDPLMLKIPVMGLLTKKIIMSRFSRNLGSLLENSVPILTSMKIVGSTTGSVVIEDALKDIELRMKRGSSLANAMKAHDIFPMEDIEMVSVGEENGDIPGMLHKIADMYEEDVEATTDALTSLIEPLMIVFLGIVVGGMIVALYLPIFSIAETFKNSG